MSRPLIIALAAMSLAPAFDAYAGGDGSNRPENAAVSPCVANSDGQPGRNNQGPGAGRGGKGGAIALNGRQPGGCAGAGGGNGGDGNRGSNAGRGGDGGRIEL